MSSKDCIAPQIGMTLRRDDGMRYAILDMNETEMHVAVRQWDGTVNKVWLNKEVFKFEKRYYEEVSSAIFPVNKETK